MIKRLLEIKRENSIYDINRKTMLLVKGKLWQMTIGKYYGHSKLKHYFNQRFNIQNYTRIQEMDEVLFRQICEVVKRRFN